MGFFANFLIPATVTLVVHAMILAALMLGWEAQSERKQIVPPKYIEARLIQLDSKTRKKASAVKKPKKVDLTARRRAQERVQREAERKRQASLRRQKEEAVKKAAAEEEEKKREELARRERQEQAQRVREREQRLRQEFEQALLAEQGMLMEEEYATEAQSYAAKFRQRVEQNWSRPPSARTGMRCVLAIQLVPTGRVVSVNVAESSGNPAFDRSAIQAVKKVEIFPEAKEMSTEVFERYYRTFKLLFDPQDLRL